ncbi:MAG: hypothetical protein JW745_08645, partial [Sedimentisphaerales bacterium]|nr:hypothetical protein [Sedimentisphaerales bacterium]
MRLKLKVKLFALMGLMATNSLFAAAHTEVVGDVRVQLLSDTLVRIELKGPNGFEDRPTFHISERNWDGTQASRNEANGKVSIKTADFSVVVPAAAKDLNGIVVVDNNGNEIWEMPVGSGAYTALKCRWDEHGSIYLFDNGDKLGYGTSVADDSYYWLVEKVDGYTRIKNKATGDYINVEKGLDYVKCTAVAADSPAKDWTAQTVEGAMTLASRHADSSLMHIENRKGYVQYSPAQTTNADGRTMDKWLSCRWLEAKDASDFFSDNRRWLPHPESETAAWAICDTPRYVPAKWGYNPAPDNSKNNGWDLDNHAADVYVFLPRGDSKRLRRDYLTLTGRTDLIPMYAFGAWDSRYYPYTQEYASAKIDRYRSEQIPLDVFVVDTDWRVGASHGYGVAT